MEALLIELPELAMSSDDAVLRFLTNPKLLKFPPGLFGAAKLM